MAYSSIKSESIAPSPLNNSFAPSMSPLSSQLSPPTSRAGPMTSLPPKKLSISVPPAPIGRDGVGIQVPAKKVVMAVKKEDGKPVKRQRKRVNTAEKRASHNAVERQRRETLNSKFLDLARLLPSLASLRRPSKSSIVNGSIHHLTLQREQRLLAARELKALFVANQELLEEVNEWRARNGIAAKPNNAWTEGCEEVVSVETEVFGNFSGVGGGEDGEGEDEGENDDEKDEEDDNSANVNHGTRQSSSSASGLMHVDEASIIAAAAAVGNNNQAAQAGVNGQGYMAYPQHQAPATAPIQFNQSFAVPAFNASSRQLSFASTAAGSPTFASSFGQDFDFNSSQHHLSNFLSENFDHNSSGSPLGGSANGSNADVVTPPQFMMDQGNHQVQTFMDSPPAGVAATSFSVGNNGDKVSDWAAQQLMLQFGSSVPTMGSAQIQQQPQMNCFDGSFGSATVPGYNNSGFHAQQGVMQNSFNGMNMSSFNNNLNATHQSLLAHQPHLAAAVFPPPMTASPPFLKNGQRMLSTSTVNNGNRFQTASPTNTTPTQTPVQGSNQAQLHAAAQAQIMQAAQGLNLSPEQMDEWKRFAMGNFLNAQAQNTSSVAQNAHAPTLHELRDAVRAGMSVGMGLAQQNWVGTSPVA